MSDNEATRKTFVRTRPTLHETEDEAGCYEAKAEAENFGQEAMLASRIHAFAGNCVGTNNLCVIVQ